MQSSELKILAVVVNLFFPGLGNVIVGQTKFGLPIFVLSLLLTFFYFLPLLAFLFSAEAAAVYLLITCSLALVAFVVDLVLMVISIVKALKA
jgi:hypothetical protein